MSAAEPWCLPALRPNVRIGLNERLERARDDVAVRIERSGEGFVVGEAHAGRDPRAVGQLAGRQQLRLLVANRLQPMFDVAQELVRDAELPRLFVRQQLMSRQRVERLDDPGALQRRLPTRPDQLMHLRGELDLANAAGSKSFTSLRIALRLRSASIRPFISRSAWDRSEVQVTAEHERLQVFDQPAPETTSPAHGRARIQA